MAVTNLGRPRSRALNNIEIVAVPVPRVFKESLEQEARTQGCRSLAQFVRLRNGWPDVTRQMGPKAKEAPQV